MALFTVLSAEDLATLDEGSALLAERPNPKLRLLFKDRLLGIRNRFLRSDELVEPWSEPDSPALEDTGIFPLLEVVS